MVYQIENGVNKLLSICGSKDSLAKAILYYNEKDMLILKQSLSFKMKFTKTYSII